MSYSIGSTGPRLPLPAGGPVRGEVKRDGVDGRSAKDATILAATRGLTPYKYFDMDYVDATAAALKKVRSLAGARAILKWPVATVTFGASATFNGARVMICAISPNSIYDDWPMPASLSYITYRMLTSARKTFLETEAAAQSYFWAVRNPFTGQSGPRLGLIKSGSGARFEFASAPGDLASLYWDSATQPLTTGAEPTADVAEMWGVRFDASEKRSRMYHNDVEIGGAIHAAATPFARSSRTYWHAATIASDSSGWVGEVQCDIVFDDTDPRRACSDQQYADVCGDLAAVLRP